MNSRHFFTRSARVVAVLGAVAIASFASKDALADNFSITYLGAGVQTPTTTPYYETFGTGSGFSGTTTFNGSGITGTYSGDYSVVAANSFGGAGGTGNFIETPGGVTSYTLTLSQPVDYFGMWFSALDSGNQLTFEYNGVVVYSFSPTDYATLVGDCPSSYCGNPSAPFLGDDDVQQYAYLNFLDTTGNFNEIVFTENPGVGDFESDNQAVAANVVTIPGTPVGVTPEPSSLILLGSGILGMAGALRRRMTQ